ncbi:MAG TPA: phosphoribosyltransferase [Dehalococcoidia bacterium]|jgi:orotate phosphoribosyltransferase|nr:phosphoribosyltransferase [Dehalococcoidia bacterium]
MGDETINDESNLWLADTLWRLGAVQFGDFTLGRTTVHSPIYVNLRLLVAHPSALARAAHIILQQVQTLQSMRHPQVDPFDVVCGVPFGGLTIAQAFSLTAKVPLIYLHPHKDDLDSDVEGIYHPSQTALIMDDLITGGGSIVLTANRLRDEGLFVRDAVVLFDRRSGGRSRLEEEGIRLVSVLTIEVLLNYLMSHGKIDESWYRKSMAYLEQQRHEGS